MNKSQLVDAVAKESGIPRKETAAVIDALIQVIPQTVKAGEKIILAKFGTFSQKTVAARMGRNPATGEKLSIPEKKKIQFKFQKGL
jgi:DNA-binding protein HU-beta